MEISSANPNKIQDIIQKHMNELNIMEKNNRHRQNELKKKQMVEYHNFVLQFYQIESQRQQELQINSPLKTQPNTSSPSSRTTKPLKPTKTAHSTQTKYFHKTFQNSLFLTFLKLSISLKQIERRLFE